MLWEFRSSWRGRSWLGSRKLWRQAGREPEAANRQHGPQPARPPPAGPPASSGCSQAFPSRCLAGRAWPCASCSTWSHPANPLTESPVCYLTLQREVLPQAGSHNQGLPGENSEPAPRPPRTCTAHSGMLRGGALAPAMGTNWGCDLRPSHHRQLGTKDTLYVGTYRPVKAHRAVTCGLVSLQGWLVCFDADARVPCKAHGCAPGVSNWGFAPSAELHVCSQGSDKTWSLLGPFGVPERGEEAGASRQVLGRQAEQAPPKGAALQTCLRPVLEDVLLPSLFRETWWQLAVCYNPLPGPLTRTLACVVPRTLERVVEAEVLYVALH